MRDAGELLTVEAREVREGDFLPGLGDGYVFMDPEKPGDYGDLTKGMRQIYFHDADGEENFIRCGKHNPIQVRRETP